MLWSIDNCQNKVSADQYRVTILRAHVLSSSRSRVFLKLTADRVTGFSIGSRLKPGELTVIRVGLFETEQVKANPGLKVNQV